MTMRVKDFLKKQPQEHYLQSSETKPDFLYLLRLQVFQRVALKFFNFLSW